MPTYVPELRSLRIDDSHEAHRVTLQSGATKWLGLRGKQLELVLKASPANTGALPSTFGVDVLATNSLKPMRTRVAVMRDKRLLAIDRTQSGDPDDADVRAGPLEFWRGFDASGKGEGAAPDTSALLLHVYVDASIVTVLAGNRTAVTVHVHPSAEALGVSLFATGSDGAVDMDVEGWRLTPVYAVPPPDARLKTTDDVEFGPPTCSDTLTWRTAIG